VRGREGGWVGGSAKYPSVNLKVAIIQDTMHLHLDCDGAPQCLYVHAMFDLLLDHALNDGRYENVHNTNNDHDNDNVAAGCTPHGKRPCKIIKTALC
jgi:hypothetical protein